MRRILAELTFGRQCVLAVGVALAAATAASLCQRAWLANAGWVLAGLLFVAHPVCPKSAEWKYGGDRRRMRRDGRIAGAVVALLGAITRFGI